MPNSYEVVDMRQWPRSMHCEVFRDCAQPQYCVSLELDVTRFREFVRERGYSFTLAMTYAVARAANEVEEFRYRFADGKVVLYGRIGTSFTWLHRDTGLFKVVNAPMCDTMEEYVRTASALAERQQEYFTGPMADDVFQFSAMPWVSYTHVSHTDSGKRDQATPLFDWGKYFVRDGRLMLPFSVQVHHSFVDGVHIGQLVGKLQRYLDEV